MRRYTLSVPALAAVLALTGSVVASHLPRTARVAADSTTLALRSRDVTLSPATTEAFLRSLRDTSARAIHALALLRRHPTEAEREALRARGLTVFYPPVTRRVYRVAVARAFDRSDSLVRSLLGALAAFQPEDRVHPAIWRGEYGRFVTRASGGDTANFLVDSGGSLRLTICVFPDVESAQVERLLAARTRTVRALGGEYWQATVDPRELRGLASLDLVRWIEAAPAPVTLDNDHTRSELGIESLQSFSLGMGVPTGLGGKGIQIGVFDTGIDEDHDDFKIFHLGYATTNRVTLTAPEKTWHGTLVAGIIAGSGRRSKQLDSWSVPNGGTPYQWRGMAPLAELLEQVVPAAIANPATTAQTFATLIATNGMDISNHSYQYESTLGEYSESSVQFDRLTHGDAVVGTVLVPPRLQVFSAGNYGGAPDVVPPETFGYFSLDKELKNALLVGSWSVEKQRIVGSSSLGPTWDGRIKPDVVAPGSQVKSTGYWAPGTSIFPCTSPPPGTTTATTERRQFYGIECGTSLAAPAVTGTLALALEQYALTYNVKLDKRPPLPSTLRGLVIHSARDLVSSEPWFTNVDGPVQPAEGPDFATGFGLVNAAAAVDVVKRFEIIERSVSATCDQQTFEWDVVPLLADLPVPPVKVTLAWDDLAGDAALGSTDPRLKNDLDLVLIDPAGTLHYPWQLNQTITDASGTTLTPEQQTCGTDVKVVRKLAPPPAAFVPADNVAATKGPDHLNNVEQVVAPGIAGRWKAVVTAFDVSGPQSYSLLGIPFKLRLVFPPHQICVGVGGGLCRRPLFDICARYPRFCDDPPIIPLTPDGIEITFRDVADRAIIPLRQLCTYRGASRGCNAAAAGQPYEITIGPVPISLGIELYSRDGAVIAGSPRPTRPARRFVVPDAAGDYILLITPPADMGRSRAYDIPVTTRMLPR